MKPGTKIVFFAVSLSLVHKVSRGTAFLNRLHQDSEGRIALIADIAGISAVIIAVTIIAEPRLLLNLVVKSALDCTFRTRPLTRLPSVFSSLIETVASPKTLGIRLCQTIMDSPIASIWDSTSSLEEISAGGTVSL